MKKRKIMLIGPFPNPITGVSLANKVVQELLDSSLLFKVQIVNTSYTSFKEDIGKFSIKKFLFYLKINLKGYTVFNQDILYITPGQTFFGVLKYAVFICLGAALKKEMIIHVHGNFLETQYHQLKGFKKKIFYFLVSKFTKGIVLSPSLKDNLIPFLEENKIFVLYNFAEDYLYKGVKNTLNKNLNITYLSNLMEEKGILYLLGALKELEKRNISYTAKIAGNIDENLEEIIIKKIRELKNTTYLGVVYQKEKKELLEWSNIFVLPTFYKMEGQPISILEALATENVVVTTNHAGISDIIKDNIHGYIIEPKSSESILKTFIFLNENKYKILEISKNNKMYFANNFTIEKFNKEIVKIINTNAKTKHI